MKLPEVLTLMAAFVLTACASPAPKQTLDVSAKTNFTQEELLDAQAQGYQLTTNNGEQVVCRRDAMTGSRLSHSTKCMTAKDWARARSSSRDALRDITRGQQPACALEGNC